MTALFTDDECGHRRPEPTPTPTPSRAERDQATLDAGLHPATGRALRETAAGEARRVCLHCTFCNLDRPARPVCTAPGAQAGARRTQRRWPACAGFVPEPPAELDGQSALAHPGVPDGA